MPITFLNDFIFCPYSLYLHQVFDNNHENIYSAKPQQVGKVHHSAIDSEKVQTYKRSKLKGIYVISRKLGIYGKIDTYDISEKHLIESKYQIKTIYQGYYYQIWAQYFALVEMGYEVNSLSFFSIKDRKTINVDIPQEMEFKELQEHIRKTARYDFEQEIKVNPVKCSHCIYASLCDKTNKDHVYS